MANEINKRNLLSPLKILDREVGVQIATAFVYGFKARGGPVD